MWLQDDPRTRKFIRSKDQYESYLRGLNADQVLELTAEGQFSRDGGTKMRMQCFELKKQVDKIKQQLHVVGMDISTLKL
jgi:hypothetical protein